MSVKSYHEKEPGSSEVFCELGPCWHLWTSEDFEIIFQNDDDYRAGMDIVAIAAKMCPDLIVLTFEIMSNHLHLCVAGDEKLVDAMFDIIKEFLRRYFGKLGRAIDWEKFRCGRRLLETMEELRNAIVYDNRNGFVVRPEYSPFTYPWGANKYFFNPAACQLEMLDCHEMSLRERRRKTHSRKADGISGVMVSGGCASPLSFCRIDLAENIFHDASHYFYKLGRSVELNAKFAKEMGESVYYTDNELFALLCKLCKEQYGVSAPSQVPSDAKLELAKMLKLSYNASLKQIKRMLKLGQNVLDSLFGTK